MSCIAAQGHVVPAHIPQPNFSFNKFKSHFSEHALKHCKLSDSYSESVPLLNTSFISGGTIFEMPAKLSHNYNFKLQGLSKISVQ